MGSTLHGTPDAKQPGAILARVRYQWIQIVVYALIAAGVAGSLSIAAICVRRGGDVEWQYKFGVLVQVSCKNTKR